MSHSLQGPLRGRGQGTVAQRRQRPPKYSNAEATDAFDRAELTSKNISGGSHAGRVKRLKVLFLENFSLKTLHAVV